MTAPLTKAMQLKHNKKPKRKRCKECNNLFTPKRDLQPCCSYGCEVAYIDSNLNSLVKDGAKNRVKEAKIKKKTINKNKKGGAISLTQDAVNEYIKLRDKNQNCISCNSSEAIQWDAGHYEGKQGKPQIRFNTLNIHKQCSYCNNQLAANLMPYRERLIQKIGLEKVEQLEQDNSINKYTIEYLERLRKIMRKKIKLYKRKFR